MTWFCVRSSTRREKAAASSLRELGFEVYLPVETRWVRHARQKTAQTYPLFSGYLFCQMTQDDLWKARTADGVHKVMTLERKSEEGTTYVSAIRGEYVDALALAEAEGKFDKTLKDRPKPKGENPMKKGQDVKIVEGRFAGFVAKVTQIRGAERVNLLVSVFGRVQNVEEAVKSLELA